MRPRTKIRTRSKHVIWSVLADLACVLALAAGGRQSHESGSGLGVLFLIVWPFALAVLLVHDVLWRRHMHSWRVWPGGLIALGATYAVGMLLRWASGRGMAPGFLVVAAIFLVVTMLGWRLVVLAIRLRRLRHTPLL